MMAREDDFLKFNNEQLFRFSFFDKSKEIKEADLINADNKTKELFNIFSSLDGNPSSFSIKDAEILWEKLKTSATTNKNGDNSVFDNEEIRYFLDNDPDINTLSDRKRFNLNNLTELIKIIFAETTADTNHTINITPQQIEKACQDTAIGIITDNISDAYKVMMSQSLGVISGTYDDNKDDDNKLKTSNVQKLLDFQNAGTTQLYLAKEGKLTRREYYEENKQRIKDMILTRLTVLKTPTGINLMDEYREQYSKEELIKIIDDYVETICNDITMDKLKEIQKGFVSYSVAEETQALKNFVNNAIDYSKSGSHPVKVDSKFTQIKNPTGIIPSYWDSAEQITFEEVYKLERGTEYSQYKVEQYVLAQKEMETVVNAYNKKQQFIDTAKSIITDSLLSVNDKIQKIMDLYSQFYALSDDNGLGELQKIINASNTLIKLGENGLDLSAYHNNEQIKQSALNKLLNVAIEQKEKDFQNFLGDKTIEEYQQSFEKSALDILGDDNAEMLAEAMKNDNMNAIQRWTGNTSMAGMGLCMIGCTLCFAPIATIGTILVVGGMIAKTGLGAVDYATKDVQTTEELEALTKDFILDASACIIGIGASKAGMKAFNKLIDKKLTAVFAKEINAGNRAQALKEVFTNPEYLKNFMTAAGAKISTDFLISYAGDLAMMGILDTNDDWKSLLQANLIGILVGMSSDIKDIPGANHSFGKNKVNQKYITQQDYGMATLGKNVTIKDPINGTKIEGIVTDVKTDSGITTVKIGDKYYSTNHIIEVENKQKPTMTKQEVEKYLKKLVNNQDYDIATYNELFKNLDNLDYDNIDIHLKHLEIFLTTPSNYKSQTVRNGYFYSKEGAEAFEILASKFSAEAVDGKISDLSFMLGRYDYKTILIAKERGLLDELENFERIMKLTSLSDAEFKNYNSRIKNLWENNSRDYESYVKDLEEKLREKMKSSSDQELYDNLFSNYVSKESVIGQLEIIEHLENLPLNFKFADYYVILKK